MELRAPVRWAVTGLLMLFAAGALFWGYRQQIRLQEPTDGAFAAPVPAGEAPVILVHVAGAVQAPGLHRLPPGARVAEAVAAAVPGPEAVPEALNLAAPLADGDKVFVPARSDLAPGARPAAAMGAHHTPVAVGATGPGGGPPQKVNVNTADERALAEVPGLGQYLAGKIVAHRKAVGRYRRLEDLLGVPGIGEAVLARIRPYVTL